MTELDDGELEAAIKFWESGMGTECSQSGLLRGKVNPFQKCELEQVDGMKGGYDCQGRIAMLFPEVAKDCLIYLAGAS